MSDKIDMFRDLKAWRQERRRVWGVPCPVCREKLPKAQPKILLPSQVCRAHKPNYRDPRPEEIESTTPDDPIPAASANAPGSSATPGHSTSVEMGRQTKDFAR